MLNEIYLILSLDAEWMGQFFAALALEIDANKDEGGDVLSVFRPTFEVVTKAMTQDTKLGDPDSFLYADLLVLFTQNEPMAQVGGVGGIGCCHCAKMNRPVTMKLKGWWPDLSLEFCLFNGCNAYCVVCLCVTIISLVIEESRMLMVWHLLGTRTSATMPTIMMIYASKIPQRNSGPFGGLGCEFEIWVICLLY